MGWPQPLSGPGPVKQMERWNVTEPTATCRTVALPKSANRQRATMQSPQ
jgi:hypothetical protein